MTKTNIAAGILDQERREPFEDIRGGLKELKNFGYPGYIFIGRYYENLYSFEEGQTFAKAKGQEKQPVDPDAIPLENFPDYTPGSPLISSLNSIISDALKKQTALNPNPSVI